MTEADEHIAVGVAKSLADCCQSVEKWELWLEEAKALLALWQKNYKKPLTEMTFEELVPFLEHWSSARDRLETDFPMRKAAAS